MSDLDILLNIALRENNLLVSAAIQQKLILYLELMRDWNRVFNLTSITETRDMVYLHIIDSLLIRPFLHGRRILDVGSGAGLPGIPLAMIMPDKYWTLIDKNNKKTRFLTQVIAELALPNVTVVHGRSQEFHPAQAFDSIVSRAFGSVRLFVETTGHLLAPHGILVAMKGKYPENELQEIPIPFQLQDVTQINMKGVNVQRHIVRIVQPFPL